MTQFFQTLVDGLTVGSLYALIALGYTMVYGILKFINFAHSDIFGLGVHMTIVIAGVFGVSGVMAGGAPSWYVGPAVLVLAMIACGAVGLFIERFAYRPLRGIAAIERVDYRHWSISAAAEFRPTQIRIITNPLRSISAAHANASP